MAEKKGRGPSRPIGVRLTEAIEKAQGRIDYHERHLTEAREELEETKKRLAAHEEEEKKTAESRIAEYEAELARLRKLVP